MSTPPERAPTRTRNPDRRARLERALDRVHGGILLSFAAVSVAPLVENADLPASQLVPRLVIVATYLCVAFDLQRRGERRAQLGLLCLPLLSAAGLQVEPLASDVASGLTVGAIALSAARQLRPSGYLAVMAPAGVAHAVLRMIAGGEADAALSDVVVGVGMTYAVYAFADSLHRAMDRSVAADEETSRQRDAAARDEAERRATAAAGRALHDEVLVALRAVGDASLDTATKRGTCARAVAAVAEIEEDMTSEAAAADIDSRAVRLADVMSAVQVASPVDVTVSLDGVSEELVISRQIADVVRRVIGEGLRNVHRHSGADRADVQVACDDDGLHLVVVDHGSGRPDDFVPGYGTSQSVVAPVDAVGGHVAFRSTPGGGTTLDVQIPLQPTPATSPLARAYDLTVRAVGTARPLHAITWPVATVWIYAALRYSWDWPSPQTSLLLAGCFVATTGAVVTHVVNRAPTRLWLTTVAAGLVALDAVSLALAPEGSLLDYRSWTMGFLAVPLVALTMVLPAWAALLVLAPHPFLLLGAVTLDPSLTDGAFPWGSVNAVLATPAAAIVLGGLLRRIGLRIEREQAESTRLSVQRAHGRSRDLVLRLHLDHARRTVLPWLDTIGREVVDPSTAHAAERAALLGSEVRDDLYAPGFLQGDVREEVTEFRRSGGTLVLRPGLLPGGATDRARDVLATLLRSLDAAHRVTVTPQVSSGEHAQHVRLAVVPPAPGSLDGLPRHCSTDVDGFRTVITVAPPG